jgi:release factor glutamine methyltransferase
VRGAGLLCFNGGVRTVGELIEAGARRLPRRDGLPDPRREARWLLARAAGVTEGWLLLHGDAVLPEETAARFDDWLARRAAGEPAHHLTGRCSFWGREFEVSPAVLVPRPETELVVAAALALPLPEAAWVLDVGTGSGCLAVTLAAERPRWSVTATDRSLPALEMARRNALGHGVGVDLACGDLGSCLLGGYELVVANLPYIPSGRLASLPLEVRHDPVLALDGGGDGLDLVRALLGDLRRLLAPGASAVLELGEDQADAVSTIADAVGLAVVRRVRDLSGCERVVVLQRRM